MKVDWYITHIQIDIIIQAKLEALQNQLTTFYFHQVRKPT